MNSLKAPLICYFHFKTFAILVIEFFKEENFKLLSKRFHFTNKEDLENFYLIYENNIKQFSREED